MEDLCRPTKRRVDSRDVLKQLRNYWKAHAEEPIDFELPHFPFLKDRYQPYHFNDAIARISPQSLSSSPGFRYQNKGYKTKRHVLADPKAVNDIRCFLHNMKQGKPRTASPVQPCIVRATKDLLTGEIKTRMAWPFPIEVYAAEAMFARPVIDSLPEDYVPTPETCHRQFCGQGYSVDFESFDASIPLWLMKRCFDNLLARFDITTYADCGDGERPVSKRYSLEYVVEYIRRYLCYTPFKVGNRFFRKYHGMPSGSMFTNLLDSMISYTVMHFSHRIAKCHAIIKTYGDDTHIAECRCFNPRALYSPEAVGLVERVQLLFGMKIKLQERCNVINTCHSYCKKKCFYGMTYHDGLWFSNIINCCRPEYQAAVAYQLAQEPYQATERQRRQLLSIGRPGPVPARLQAFLDLHLPCPSPSLHI